MAVTTPIPPPVPRQDEPPLLDDKGGVNPNLFTRRWWLFFQALAKWLASTNVVVNASGIISRAGTAFANAILRLNWDKHGERPSVLDYGALADGIIVFDGAINSASHTFTSASADFSSADIGKTIWIEGAGAAGSSYTKTTTQTTTTARDLLGIIASINSPTSVTVSTVASATVSGAEARWGTDNTDAIQLAFDQSADQGYCLEFPCGIYLTTDSLTLQSNLMLKGQGYTYTSWENNAAAMVACCANVPVMKALGTTEGDGLLNFNMAWMVLRGTRRPGSMGISSAYTLGAMITFCGFSIFGDQAVFLDTNGLFGIHVSDCSATDCLLVDDRTDYVGGFEFGPSDLFIARLESVGPGIFNTSGLFGSGYIAAIKVTGNNSFVSDCIAAGSQVGYHVGASNPIVQLTSTFVNCRADQNQGHGFVISGNSWSCHFLGCRSHNNALGATATYSGFHVTNGTHQFTGCQVTKTPVGPSDPTSPFNNLYRDCFYLSAGSDAYEPIKCNLCFIGNAYVGISPTTPTAPTIFSRDAYHVVAPTREPIILWNEIHEPSDQFDFTSNIQYNAKLNSIYFEGDSANPDTSQWAIGANALPGSPNDFGLVALNDARDTVMAQVVQVHRNATTGLIDYIIWKDNGGVYFESSVGFVDMNCPLSLQNVLFYYRSAAFTNEKRWTWGPTQSGTTSGTGEFTGQTLNDAVSAGVVWLRVNRTGIVVDRIQLNATAIELNGTITGTFVIGVASGGTGQSSYTKGDLLAAAGSTTLNKLAVGSNGKVLTANSAATNGVDWEDAPGEDNNYLTDESGGLSCTTSYASTGISVTLNQDGYWLIVGTFDATVNATGLLLEGALYVNGSIQTGVVPLSTQNAGDVVRAAISRTWIYHNTGGATPVAELYAKVGSTSGGGAGIITTTNSNITAVFLHS